MIHLTPEGQILSIGLNVTLGTLRKPYVTFRWVWYDTRTRMLSCRRFRVRLYQWPAFVWSKDERHAVRGWLWENDLTAVPNVMLEDYAPFVLDIMRAYAAQGRDHL